MKGFDRSTSRASHGDAELIHNSTAGVVEIILWDDFQNKSAGWQTINVWDGQIDDMINLLQTVSKEVKP